jgi:hypothetical protein
MINWYYIRERLARIFQPPVDLPAKTDPSQFGGGRSRRVYLNDEIGQYLCSRAGCNRQAHASWGGCADNNIARPLCAECDVLLNYLALLWWGDPETPAKMAQYAASVEEDIGRKLEPDAWNLEPIIKELRAVAES